MRRLAAVLALLVATEASAATYWVRPSATGSGSGADSSNAMTLASANAAVVAGDVVRLLNGTYSSPIQPDASGTPGSQIVYLGNQSAPSAVSVANIYFGRETTASSSGTWGDYVTVKWVATTGNLSQPVHLRSVGPWYACNGDSALKVAVGGSVEMHGDNSVFDSLTVTGSGNFTIEPHPNSYPSFDWVSDNQTIKNSTFTLTRATSGSGNSWFFEARNCASLKVLNNTFNLVSTTTNTGYTSFFQFYLCTYMNFNDNVVTLTDNGTSAGTDIAFSLRDYSHWNQIFRNSFTLTGSNTDISNFYLVNSGSNFGVSGNRWEGNTFKGVGNTSSGLLYYQGPARLDTLRFNLAAVSNAARALYMEPSVRMDSCRIAHNTFYSANGTVFNVSATANASRMVSNIFYGTTANGSGSGATVIVPSGMGMDSVGVIFNRLGTSANAIRYNGVNGAPGSGTTGYGLSTKAVWNTPRFTDSTYTTLNTTLLSGSPADDDNLHDGFAGAVGASTVDAIRPATVTPLSVSASSTSSITLAWTSVGDDSLTGTALAYDIRYSTSPITAANFNSASQATGMPLPAVAGSAESFTVTGLAPSTVYHFALKTGDGDNWSAISDTARCATTNVGDVTAPAAVTDLTAIPSGSTSMFLAWTSVADDGTDGASGACVTYTVKRSTSAINSGNFDAATTVTYSDRPQDQGGREQLTDTGLSAATTYYYAVKGVDDAGNAGAISNLPNAATQAASDVTAPGQLTLTAPSVGSGTVNLAWAASGNDGSIGGAASAFDVRYRAGSTFVEADWAGATTVLGEPTPGVPGTQHTITVGGLTNSTQYAFAIKADDAAGNHSTISAAVTGTPVAATVALIFRRGRGRR